MPGFIRPFICPCGQSARFVSMISYSADPGQSGLPQAMPNAPHVIRCVFCNGTFEFRHGDGWYRINLLDDVEKVLPQEPG